LKDFFEEVKEFEESDLLPIIKPKISVKDIKLMSDKPIKEIHEVLIPGYLFLCIDKSQEFNILVESISGKIITNVDEYKTKILPELDKLTPKEVKVLHTAFQLKKFNKEELIKKIGLAIDKELTSLINKNYIVKNQKYQLSDKYVLSHLSKYACYNKIEFLKINYNLKKEAKLGIDEIKEKLSKFTTIKDQRECFILKHEITY
jgi:hypothetical protein